MKRIALALLLCFVVSTLSAGTESISLQDSVFTRSAKLYYPINLTEKVTSYMDNAKVMTILSTLNKDNFTVESIRISGWASPEGRTLLNQSLSEKRAATLKSILQEMYNFPESVYHIEGNGENWEELKELCLSSNNAVIEKYADEIKQALSKENINARKAALKAIGKGQVYWFLTKEILPKLRYADCEIVFRFQEISEEDAKNLDIAIPAPVVEQPVAEPEPEPVSEPEPEVVEEPAPEPQVCETNWGKWRISIAAGPQIYYGDNDRRLDNNDRVRLGIYANIERWFNDYIGMGIGINAAGVNGLYHDHYALNDDDPRWRKPDKGIYRSRDGKNYYWQKTWLFNPSVYVVTNLLNDFGGRKNGGRIYNLLLSAGVGVPFANSSYHDKTYAGFSMNASLINSFRITDHFDLQILLNGGALNDNFDGEVSKHVFDGTASIMGGCVWRF